SPRPPRAERARRSGRRSPAGAPRTPTASGATDSGPTEDRRRRRRRRGGRPVPRGTAASFPPLYQSLHAEKQAGPGSTPGPPCCVTTRLELVPHASRADHHVAHANVPPDRPDHRVRLSDEPVRERIAREQVATGEIERQARSEPIRKAGVELGAEVVAVTLRLAGDSRLPAGE